MSEASDMAGMTCPKCLCHRLRLLPPLDGVHESAHQYFHTIVDFPLVCEKCFREVHPGRSKRQRRCAFNGFGCTRTPTRPITHEMVTDGCYATMRIHPFADPTRGLCETHRGLWRTCRKRGTTIEIPQNKVTMRSSTASPEGDEEEDCSEDGDEEESDISDEEAEENDEEQEEHEEEVDDEAESMYILPSGAIAHRHQLTEVEKTDDILRKSSKSLSARSDSVERVERFMLEEARRIVGYSAAKTAYEPTFENVMAHRTALFLFAPPPSENLGREVAYYLGIDRKGMFQDAMHAKQRLNAAMDKRQTPNILSVFPPDSRGRPVLLETADRFHSWLASEDSGCVMTTKVNNHVVCRRTGEKHIIWYRPVPYRQLCLAFSKKHKVSLATLYRLQPFWLRKVKIADGICVHHGNVSFLVAAFNQFRLSLQNGSQKNTRQQTCKCKAKPPPLSFLDLPDEYICQIVNDNGTFNPSCVDGDCDHCGPEVLLCPCENKILLGQVGQKLTVTYKQWKTITVLAGWPDELLETQALSIAENVPKKRGRPREDSVAHESMPSQRTEASNEEESGTASRKTYTATRRVIFTRSAELFLKMFVEKLRAFARHCHRATLTKTIRQSVIDEMCEGDLYVHVDWIQNKDLHRNGETQSEGWSRLQLAIFCAIVYFPDTAQNQCQAYFLVSHDVQEKREAWFTVQMIDTLFNKLSENGYQFDRVFLGSDGGGGDFKSNKMFLSLRHWIDAQVHITDLYQVFTESYHGKGVWDSEGGRLKRAIDNVISGGWIAPHGSSVHDSIVDALRSSQPQFFAPSGDFIRQRHLYAVSADKSFAKLVETPTRTVPRLKEYFCVRISNCFPSKTIHVRKFLCVCDACFENRPAACVNNDANHWEVHNFQTATRSRGGGRRTTSPRCRGTGCKNATPRGRGRGTATGKGTQQGSLRGGRGCGGMGSPNPKLMPYKKGH